MLRNESLIEQLAADEERLVAIRRDLHEHPELGLEEHRTSELVARTLTEWGWKVHTGLARTGVVATLSNGTGRKSVGIRADFDALPIHEETGLDYASKIPGKMHACGHDGHTTMLLGAAKLIAERKNFDGTVHLIFQPAEENHGGAGIMVEEGLFEKFPCDAVFALHNEPNMPAGKLGFRSGPLMAAVDQIQVTLYGKGGHGAQPHETVDPIVISASYVLALQSIVSRNVDPLEASVVTVGCLKSGAVCNIIPESAFLDIGYRHFKPEIGALIGRRIAELAEGTAKAYGGRAEVTVVRGYPVLVNEAEQTRFAKQVGAELFGEDRVYDIDKPFLGSEDFSYMLQQRPGTYLMIGNGESASLHNPRYNFNDAILTTGAAYWTGLVERYLRP